MTARTMKVALTAALLLALCGLGAAQNGYWRGGDGDHDADDRYSNPEWREHRRFYDQGIRDAQEDREHHRGFYIRERRWDDARDRDAYIAGYRAGFGDAGGSRWRDPDDRGGWYGNGSYRGNGQARAYNFGYQDGDRDGAQDRRTGHSFRPTHDDNYKHADRGYNSFFGSKQQYKNEYRDGYTRGYQRGYNSGRW
jgi:hypothetical protein